MTDSGGAMHGLGDLAPINKCRLTPTVKYTGQESGDDVSEIFQFWSSPLDPIPLGMGPFLKWKLLAAPLMTDVTQQLVLLVAVLELRKKSNCYRHVNRREYRQ